MSNTSQARFLTGPLWRHITIMSATGAIGLMAIFASNFVDMYFLSLLSASHTAAVGFSSTILFFATSVSIGLGIGASASVARALGRGDQEHARKRSTHALLVTVLAGMALAALVWFNKAWLLELLNATNAPFVLAVRYLNITAPGTFFLTLMIVTGGILRGIGDAKGAMNITLFVGLANAILDPIFIFGLNMDIEGAALASLLSQLGGAVVGLYKVRRHQMLTQPDPATFRRDMSIFWSVAGPAVATNMATPFANGYANRVIATFGEAAVSAYAVIGIITPLAFAGLFSLSGAVGPVIGQNYGAGDISRVRSSLLAALWCCLIYCGCVVLLLILMRHPITRLFSMEGEAAHLVTFWALFVAPIFVFNGLLFTANASFNNLDRPLYSAAFNISRASIGTIPFVWFGAQWYDAEGVLMGQALGGVIFGLGAYLLAWRVSRKLDPENSGATA